MVEKLAEVFTATLLPLDFLGLLLKIARRGMLI